MIGNCLLAEKSMLTVLGPRRLSRPQFPNVPATGLEKAAAFHQPWPPAALGLGETGSTPTIQLSLSPLGEKTTPAESHEAVSVAAPLCAVVMVLNSQPPTS